MLQENPINDLNEVFGAWITSINGGCGKNMRNYFCFHTLSTNDKFRFVCIFSFAVVTLRL